ncbi:MAG: GntR family transcriptional regulator [Planctomycetes bacterium]|nr:GntR family transcriptional regulator [Planctomycetota bacterium]
MTDGGEFNTLGITLNTMSVKPKYIIAKEKILKEIRTGNYQLRDSLPSINKLTGLLDVGRIGVQRAMQLLVEEGVIESIHGSGCYVKVVPPIGLPEVRSDYFANTIAHGARKKIKIAIQSSELQRYPELWKKICGEIMGNIPEIEVETLPCSDHDLLRWNPDAAPDILQITAGHMPYFAKKGLLFDLNELSQFKLPEGEFYEGFRAAADYDGKDWGVPLVAAVNCLFFDKQMEDSLSRALKAEKLWGFMSELDQNFQNNNRPMLINGHPPFSFFLAAMGKRRDRTTCEDILNDDDLEAFLQKFERYFLNHRLFYHDPASFHSHYSAFFQEKGAMMTGLSCWMPSLIENCPFDCGVAPQPVEPSGFIPCYAVVNCISAFSQYPKECMEILKHLACYETQRSFAEKGRMVAHRRACSHLNMPHIDDKATQKLVESLENAWPVRSSEKFDNEDLLLIISHEMKHWRDGQYSVKQLLEELRERAGFYIRSQKLKAMAAKGLIDTAGDLRVAGRGGTSLTGGL